MSRGIIECVGCSCKSVFEAGAPIQKPPKPDCGCHCHSNYWMIQGEKFREEVRPGKKADSTNPSAAMRLLRR